MNTITILGLIAGTLTTTASFPQLIKSLKTKSTKDVSLGMFSLLCAGILMWFVYGLYIMSWPIILANIITFFASFPVLILKLRYK